MAQSDLGRTLLRGEETHEVSKMDDEILTAKTMTTGGKYSLYLPQKRFSEPHGSMTLFIFHVWGVGRFSPCLPLSL